MQLLKSRLGLIVPTAVVALLAGCGNSDSSLQVNEKFYKEPLAVTAGSIDVHNDLVLPFVEPGIGASIASLTGLINNGDLEFGTDSWYDCKGSSGSTLSANSASGNSALSVPAGNCVYNPDISASPGDVITLSCETSVSDSSVWAALGLGFSTSEWEAINTAPTALTTSSKYTSHSVSATVPFNTANTTMWFFSESDALIDNCTVSVKSSLEPDEPEIVLTDGSNLLVNPTFELSSGNSVIPDWFIGCEKSGIAQPLSSGLLQLSGSACIAQSLSDTDIAMIRGNDYQLQCQVNNGGSNEYADVVIGFDGVETSESKIINGLLKLTGRAPEELTNGFVGIYSELAAAKPLTIESCSLTVKTKPTDEIPDPDPETPATDEDTTQAALDYRLTTAGSIEVLQQDGDDWTVIAVIPATDGATFHTFRSIYRGADPEDVYVVTRTEDAITSSIFYFSRASETDWTLQQIIGAETRRVDDRNYTSVYDYFPSELHIVEDVIVAKTTLELSGTRSFSVSKNYIDIYMNQSGTWQHVAGPDDIYPNFVNTISKISVSSDEIIYSTYKYRDYTNAEVAVLKRNQGGTDAWGLSQVIPKPEGLDGFGSPLQLSEDSLTIGSYSDTTTYVRDDDGNWVLANESN